MAGEHPELVRAISLVDVRNELGGNKALEVAGTTAADPDTGPVGLREIPDADGAIEPYHDHFRDVALLGQVSDGACHVEEMRLAVEQEKNRVASVLRPSVALRQGDPVGPILVEDSGMDA